MIDEIDGNKIFVCDGCGKRSTGGMEGDDFRQRWYTLHDRGWVAFKDRDGDWCHLCKSCRAPSKGSILDQQARKRA